MRRQGVEEISFYYAEGYLWANFWCASLDGTTVVSGRRRLVARKDGLFRVSDQHHGHRRAGGQVASGVRSRSRAACCVPRGNLCAMLPSSMRRPRARRAQTPVTARTALRCHACRGVGARARRALVEAYRRAPRYGVLATVACMLARVGSLALRRCVCRGGAGHAASTTSTWSTCCA